MRKAVEALLCAAVIAVAWTSATTNSHTQPANPSTAASAAPPQGASNPALRPHVPYLTTERRKQERARAIGQQHSQQIRRHPEWAKLRRLRQFRQHPEWAKLRRSRQFRQHPEWAKSHRWWLLHHQDSRGKGHPKSRAQHGRY
jgi:hypothetical protein